MTVVEVTALANDPHVQRWREHARWSLVRASQLQGEGDEVGASLVLARGETRRAASEMLRAAESVDDASTQMLDTAWRLRQFDVSWAYPDESCLTYTRARTWQDCAHQLDPTLPEVQPCWD
ncbi:MAG: hypothetical protein ACRDRL_22535 [Sciscionella sp.]